MLQNYSIFRLTVFVVSATLIVGVLVTRPEFVAAGEHQVAYERAAALLAQVKTWQSEGQVASFQQTMLTTTHDAQQPESRTAPHVPFYSQFADISDPEWQGVGCGIAGIAMLIDHYSTAAINVDALLQTGIERNAFLSHAGWTHAGLIGLSRDYGLDGESRSYASLTMNEAFAALSQELSHGPVMASVHYTFEPTNPIPHLVVINRIDDGLVYYNDPAELSGNGSLPIEKFQRAWKKRFIVVRPTHT